MNTHPSLLMIIVWLTSGLVYAILPFQLIGRTVSLEGFGIFGLFLLAFFLGVAVIGHAQENEDAEWQRMPDFSRVDRILKWAGMLANICFLIDLQGRDVFDLTDAYLRRSDQASALLAGVTSASSTWFQLGFLFYPAGYVYVARHLTFEKTRSLPKLFAFGFLPVLLATLAMGGRSPLFYCLVITVLASSARQLLQTRQQRLLRRQRRLDSAPLATFAFISICGTALYYFVEVFLTRAEVSGGTATAFDWAESAWGIGFRGTTSEFWFQVLGEEGAYLAFVFPWYFIQGLLMGTLILGDYDGPMQFGVYGVDLISAVARRVDGSLVASHFDSLMQLGTYGFFPSAFGSLFVDFRFLGLPPCALWGALTGLVYQRIRARRDARWLLCGPFVTAGILFSFNNTPLGVSNGLMTHIWLLLAFRMSIPRRAESTTAVESPSLRSVRPVSSQ